MPTNDAHLLCLWSNINKDRLIVTLRRRHSRLIQRLRRQGASLE